MRRSPDEQTQELSIQLQSQMFYEESYLLMLVGLCRTYHGKILTKEYALINNEMP